MNSANSKKTNNTLDMVKMGKYIAELRKRKGYTQKKLGEILDISDKTISKWELGFIAPDITLINALAIALDVTVEEILVGEDIPDKQKSNHKEDNKNKIIKGLLILSLLCLSLLLFIFFIHDYNKWELITIKGSDAAFNMSGYVLTNGEESRIIIDKISYVDSSAGTTKTVYSDYIVIEIFLNEEQLFYEMNDLTGLNIPISSFLEKHAIVDEEDCELNGNLSIHIEYTDKSTEESHINIINLKK